MRALELLALCTFAVGQPVLSLVTSSPEFFSARKTPGAAVVAFALALTFGVPLLFLAAEWAAERIRPGWGHTLHDGLRLLLLSGVALSLLNSLDLEVTRSTGFGSPGWALILLAVVLGLGALQLLRRSQASRLLVRFMAVAAPAAVLVFLASVPVRAPANTGATEARRPAPIVMIVLDELPTTSLLSSATRIDAHRLPNFARLAREGTFYPNATTVADQTTAAVPAMLSGRRGPRRMTAPERGSWPRNLFALLRSQYSLDVREPITRLCPPDACPGATKSAADAVGALASETGHLAVLSIAPKDMAPRSPLIGGADVRDVGVEFNSFSARIGRHRAKPALDFLHVLAPHRPWARLPSGRPYAVKGDEGVPASVRETLRLTKDRKVALALWRAHLLQLGYADRLIGRVIERLRKTGRYDRSLIVVAADHGVSFRPGQPLRDVTPANVDEIAPVPLFIKLPHGRNRGTDLAPAQTIDVLPTILDAIGARRPPGLGGVSLLGRVPRRPVRVLSTHGTYVNTTLHRLLRARARSLRVQRGQVIDSPEWRSRCRQARSGC